MERQEWVLYKNYEDPYSGAKRVGWSLEGELTLSLLFIKPQLDAEEAEPWFEIARFIKDPDHLRMVSPFWRGYAMEDIKNDGMYIDVFWLGRSPEEVEEFCRQSLLPIPEGINNFGISKAN